MDDDFNCNARQYFKFDEDFDADDNADAFFETERHNEADRMHEDEKICVFECDDERFFTPSDVGNDSFMSTKTTISAVKASIGQIRRSMSMETLNQPTSVQFLHETKECKPPSNCLKSITNELERVKLEPKPSKFQLPRRAISNDNVRLTKAKRCRSQDNVRNDDKKKSYVSMAEAALKFQKDTPERFRSKAAPKLFKPHMLPMALTMPHTPNLATKKRHRDVVNVITREEQERLEYEECQKQQVKANPLNKRIFKEPVIMPKIKKPATVIQPFQLTEVKKKEVENNLVVEFHARPVPKTLHDPPKYLKELKPKIQTKAEPVKVVQNNVRKYSTKPIPFSFSGRDEEISKKREALLKKVQEEERKAREFHAKPVPKTSRSTHTSRDNLNNCGRSTISNSSNPETDLPYVFAARPAAVLHQPPFVPTKTAHVLPVHAFQLATSARKPLRDEYDRRQREAEAARDRERAAAEEAARRAEEEERAARRRLAEHRAQPIRKFKPVPHVQPKELTQPSAPNFCYSAKFTKNKENIEV